MYESVEDFVRLVDEGSNGRIKITHYPGTLLGDYGVQQQSVAAGTQAMAFVFPQTAINPKWDVRTLNYIVYNWEQAYEMFKPGGWMVSLWDQIALESNWKILVFSCVGSNTMISNKLFDPLNPEGLKVRVPGFRSWVAAYKSLGFSPVGMPMAEVASALALNTIDASAGCSHAEFKIYGDAFEYVYAYQDLFQAAPLVMNLDLWNSLSPGDQQFLLSAAQEATEDKWPEFTQIVADEWNGLLDFQKVVSLDGDGWATCAQKVRASQWDVAEAWIGKDLVDIVRANAAPLPWGKTIDEMNYGFGINTSEWLINRQGEVIYGP